MGIKAKNMDFKIKHMDAHMEKKVSWPETLLLHFLCLCVWCSFSLLQNNAVCRQIIMLEIHRHILQNAPLLSSLLDFLHFLNPFHHIIAQQVMDF